jgi:hypothetical protein
VQQVLHDTVAVALDALALPDLSLDAINGVILMLGSSYPGQFFHAAAASATRVLHASMLLSGILSTMSSYAKSLTLFRAHFNSVCL